MPSSANWVSQAPVELCVEALNIFISAYGAEAGNLALKILSVGGMYVGGGIAPKLLKKMQDGTFMKAFTDKGRLSDFLVQTPVRLILESRAALMGAAAYAEARAADVGGHSERAQSVQMTPSRKEKNSITNRGFRIEFPDPLGRVLSCTASRRGVHKAAILFVFALLAAGSRPALAHAVLVSSTPQKNAAVSGPTSRSISSTIRASTAPVRSEPAQTRWQVEKIGRRAQPATRCRCRQQAMAW